jgi:hypothetical protein
MNKYPITPTENGFDLHISDKEFRIMQLTDMHYYKAGILDKWEMRSIRDFCQRFQTNLIINTGDFFGHRPATTAIKIATAFDKIVGIYIPWAFAWGNHDNEMISFKGKIHEYDQAEKGFASLTHCLYKPSREFIEQYPGPSWETDTEEFQATTGYTHDFENLKGFDGFYGGNYLIRVFRSNFKTPAWHLFILNSRQHKHIPPKALQWMQDCINAEKEKVPALCFYHVPNCEYNQIWNDGVAQGIKGETVCSEHDKGRIHNFFRQTGTVRACFVGHDHVNDYWGEKDGVRYVYGRKTGFHGYGSYKNIPSNLGAGKKGIKIGGTQIILQLDASTPIENKFSHQSVFPDGTTWDYKSLK